MEPSTNAMTEAFQAAGVPRQRRCSLTLAWADEAKTMILVSATGERGGLARRFPSQHVLMLEISRLLRDFTEDSSWATREASQVTSGISLASSSQTLTVALDLMAPYRNPVRDLANPDCDGITLHLVPSRGYFFKRMVPTTLIQAVFGGAAPK